MNNQLNQRGEIKGSFSTRSASGQDLAKLVSLTSRNENWVSEISIQLQNRNIRILVAEQDDQLVGYTYFRVVRGGVDEVDGNLKRFVKRYLGIHGNEFDAIIRPLRIGLIQEIFVSPELRRQGIASGLIEACIECSRIQQISELQVEIYPEEEALVSFFRKIGFTDSRVTIQRSLPKRLPKHKEYIRLAEKDDLPQLIDLIKKQIIYQESLANSFELLTEIDWSWYVLSIIKNRGAMLMVAEQNDRIVGYFEGWIYLREVHGIKSYIRSTARRFIFPTKEHPEPFGVMEHVYVLPEFRKRDVAQNLVLGAAKWFRDQGVEEVLGSVWVNNESTLNLTRVIGFKVIKVILSKRI